MSKELKIILVDDDLKEIKQFKLPKPKSFKELKSFLEKNISKNIFVLTNLGEDRREVKTQQDYEYASYYNEIYVREIASGRDNLA